MVAGAAPIQEQFIAIVGLTVLEPYLALELQHSVALPKVVVHSKGLHLVQLATTAPK